MIFLITYTNDKSGMSELHSFTCPADTREDAAGLALQSIRQQSGFHEAIIVDVSAHENWWMNL